MFQSRRHAPHPKLGFGKKNCLLSKDPFFRMFFGSFHVKFAPWVYFSNYFLDL